MQKLEIFTGIAEVGSGGLTPLHTYRKMGGWAWPMGDILAILRASGGFCITELEAETRPNIITTRSSATSSSSYQAAKPTVRITRQQQFWGGGSTQADNKAKHFESGKKLTTVCSLHCIRVQDWQGLLLHSFQAIRTRLVRIWTMDCVRLSRERRYSERVVGGGGGGCWQIAAEAYHQARQAQGSPENIDMQPTMQPSCQRREGAVRGACNKQLL
ncbi:hypothetical protein FN846DRAFT_888170 [Sphaerosporella brunnea]|uniref:Uncharacterized protein n=1 Tax=Sphaerosporella brunnea TaxID=1250544 RepID=A0A5J5F3B5_9PEZI|nr:hypothetical protein FN846DRAFT_888170 [Sphaerosporella brunnea]